ncbi:response regulator, partial [Candidatus Binatia bacterium]|nr:response regulator [Candidatus Binatia bacterium]
SGLSLLVVEDDEMTAEALQLALESEGASVAVAGTIADGLARFREAALDAVLSDLRVGDGDGLTLVGEIRRSDGSTGRRTVAVAVTGDDSRETRAAARAAGFDETVTKPFAIDALVATVVRLIAAR